MKIAGQKKFGLGDFSVGLVQEMLVNLCRFGFSPDMVKKIADIKSGMAEKIVNIFSVATDAVRDGVFIVVDYTRSLAEMIKAGAYDWVNSDITESHFPVQGQGKQELVPEIIHYGKFMSSDDIVKDLDKRGLRRGTVHELCSYGEKFPDEQRKYPIVALGSVWRGRGGDRCVACLYGDDSKRELCLALWDGDWGGIYRFLAFRK
jgi:hypothetical protein